MIKKILSAIPAFLSVFVLLSLIGCEDASDRAAGLPTTEYELSEEECKHPDAYWRYSAYEDNSGTVGVRICSKCGKREETYQDSCHHTVIYNVTKEATCEEPGEVVHFCTRCGRQETVETRPLYHKWNLIEDTSTCTEIGTLTYQCGYCGKISSHRAAQPLGHLFSAANCTYPEICTRCGLRQGVPQPNDHDIQTNGICQYCGKDYFSGLTFSKLIENFSYTNYDGRELRFTVTLLGYEAHKDDFFVGYESCKTHDTRKDDAKMAYAQVGYRMYNAAGELIDSGTVDIGLDNSGKLYRSSYFRIKYPPVPTRNNPDPVKEFYRLELTNVS